MSTESSPLREHLENHLDAVDAAVFSGDSFDEAPAIERLRYYLARWERELALRSAPPAQAANSGASVRASAMTSDEKVQTLVDLGFEVTFRHFRDRVGVHCRVQEGANVRGAQEFLWGKDLNAALMAAAAVAITGRPS